MKKYILPIGIIGLLLVPYGWIGELIPAFGFFVDYFFSTELAHTVGHTMIFMLIGFMLLTLFPKLQENLWPYMAIILVIALAQEGFQLSFKLRPPALDDLRDIVVDLAAAFFTYVAFWVTRYRVLQTENS